MTKTINIELPSHIVGNEGDGGSEIPIDIKALLALVLRRLWLIGLLTSLVFSAVAYSTLTQTPIYKAEAVVIVDRNQVNVTDWSSVLSGAGLNTAVMDTEVKVMGSKSLLTKVVRKLNLTENPEFNPRIAEKKLTPIDQLKQNISNLLGREEEEEIDPFTEMSVEEQAAELEETAVNLLLNRVSVSRVGTTYLMKVAVRSTSPEMAADLANAVAEQYRVGQLDDKLEAISAATKYLSGQVQVLREEVVRKEREVENYRAASGLLAAQGTTLTETNIAMLERQRVDLEAKLNQVQVRYNDMVRQRQAGGGVNSVAEVLDSQVISDLKSQRAVILRRVAELDAKYGPRHPEVVVAKGQAEDIQRQINAEVSRITASMEREVQVAKDQLAQVTLRINKARGQLIRDNTALVRLRELERDADASRKIYEQFVERSKQTSQEDTLVRADARILSSASVPTSPSTPKTKLNLIIGLLLGGIVGVAAALMSELFDSKLNSAEDIETRLKVNTIGNVPLIKSLKFLGFGKQTPADFLVENPMSAYAESIRQLRAAIAFSDIDSSTQVVTLTSSLPDEGKTSLCLSLGRMSAMSGAKTLVIDGDFRRRQLTSAAGMDPRVGFVEYLFGEGELHDAVHRDSKTDLDVLGLSLKGHAPHDVFGTQAYDTLIAKLREMYDLILIDTGPILLMAESRIVASKSDKTILLVRWRHSKRQAVKKSLRILKDFQADLLGVTLNMVDYSRRRQNQEPGSNYKAYRKYYTMEPKRFRLFKKRSAEMPTIPPEKPRGEAAPKNTPKSTAKPASPPSKSAKPKAASPAPAKPEAAKPGRAASRNIPAE